MAERRSKFAALAELREQPDTEASLALEPASQPAAMQSPPGTEKGRGRPPTG